MDSSVICGVCHEHVELKSSYKFETCGHTIHAHCFKLYQDFCKDDDIGFSIRCCICGECTRNVLFGVSAIELSVFGSALWSPAVQQLINDMKEETTTDVEKECSHIIRYLRIPLEYDSKGLYHYGYRQKVNQDCTYIKFNETIQKIYQKLLEYRVFECQMPDHLNVMYKGEIKKGRYKSQITNDSLNIEIEQWDYDPELILEAILAAYRNQYGTVVSVDIPEVKELIMNYKVLQIEYWPEVSDGDVLNQDIVGGLPGQVLKYKNQDFKLALFFKHIYWVFNVVALKQILPSCVVITFLPEETDKPYIHVCPSWSLSYIGLNSNLSVADKFWLLTKLMCSAAVDTLVDYNDDNDEPKRKKVKRKLKSDDRQKKKISISEVLSNQRSVFGKLLKCTVETNMNADTIVRICSNDEQKWECGNCKL